MPRNEGARPGTEHGRAELPAADAFESIYEQHFDFVWRYVVGRGVPASAVEDVVQEVFMTVHGRLETFEGRSMLKTWIIGIAVNVVRSYLRRTGQRIPRVPIEDQLHLEAPEPSAQRLLELKDAATFVQSVLARMTDLQREAFVLCEMEQLSAPETSELLGVNENTLRTRLRAARRIFEEELLRWRIVEERGHG
jgi:RNA polymerase sigma-70 factor (ECF subfamily)